MGNQMNIVDTLVLQGLQGVGARSLCKILEFSKEVGFGTLEELAEFDTKQIPLRVVPKFLIELLSEADFEHVRASAEHQIEQWALEGIHLIQIYSDQYPSQLLALEDPPPVLYCKGNLALLKQTRSIAVIGTRNNTPLGGTITRQTVKALQPRGFSVVSGLAIGIDTIAHRSALDLGVPTIAVLVDLAKIAPSQNRGLADEILANDGLLIAENKPGTQAIPALFAKRDRIQAGLAAGVFAIETDIKGGTMHAVSAAAKMGRPVYVPDPVAARYEDLTEMAIQGTQLLVRDNRARYYTSDSYAAMFEELEVIARGLRMGGDEQYKTNQQD